MINKYSCAKLCKPCIILLSFISFCISCTNNRPADLVEEKTNLINELNELQVRYKNSQTVSDYQLLINEYKNLKTVFIDFETICKNRGIPNNVGVSENIDNLIDHINQVIDNLTQQVNYANNSNSIDNAATNYEHQSYNLGYEWAGDQIGKGIDADCNYLYEMAKTQNDNIDYSSFCEGVNDWIAKHSR